MNFSIAHVEVGEVICSPSGFKKKKTSSENWCEELLRTSSSEQVAFFDFY